MTQILPCWCGELMVPEWTHEPGELDSKKSAIKVRVLQTCVVGHTRWTRYTVLNREIVKALGLSRYRS